MIVISSLKPSTESIFKIKTYMKSGVFDFTENTIAYREPENDIKLDSVYFVYKRYKYANKKCTEKRMYCISIQSVSLHNLNFLGEEILIEVPSDKKYLSKINQINTASEGATENVCK